MVSGKKSRSLPDSRVESVSKSIKSHRQACHGCPKFTVKLDNGEQSNPFYRVHQHYCFIQALKSMLIPEVILPPFKASLYSAEASSIQYRNCASGKCRLKPCVNLPGNDAEHPDNSYREACANCLQEGNKSVDSEIKFELIWTNIYIATLLSTLLA